MYNRRVPGNASSLGYNQMVAIYLSPQAVITETEILTYDVYNLLGDVGGVLGLLLGYSLLSCFDACRKYAKEKKYQMEIPLWGDETV